MLTDAEEIRIISEARQKNVRDPSRSRQPFHTIFREFFGSVDLNGQVLLDLGPGQYDFAVLAAERGARTHNIDNDPPVVALGEAKGFPARKGDLKRLAPCWYDFRFDGLFCKYSINAFWFHADDEAHRGYIRGLGELLKPRGWGWIAPWNGAPKKAALSESRIAHVLRVQAETFREIGFAGWDLTEDLSIAYGVHGRTANRALFVRNVSKPAALRACAPLP